MSSCGSCRWWVDDPDKLTFRAGEMLTPLHPVTYEQLPNTDPKCGVCRSPKLLFFERPSEGQATVVDGSEYFAALVTTETFGCTNHEPVS